MPLYEYHCEPCNERFEALRPMSKGNDPATCPVCGGASRRVLSVFAAVTAGGPSEAPLPMPMPRGGGGCGSGCSCH